MIISAAYFESFITNLYARVPGTVNWTFDQQNAMIVTDCDAQYPNVYIMLDSKWITIAPKDYIFDVSQGQDRSQCIMFFTPGEMAMNIFGMPLFIDYYTVHDPESGNVGWAPHSASNKGDVTRGTPPTAQFLEIGQVNQS